MCIYMYNGGRTHRISIFSIFMEQKKKQIHRILPPDPPSSNSNEKSIEKLIFPAFGKILVLVNAFFYANSILKSIKQLIFSAFGKILVLVNAFFYSNPN